MLAIPISFVAVLFLVVLLIRQWRQNRDARFFTATTVFLAASAVLMSIVGLRWHVETGLMAPFLGVIQPILAASLPPLAWICFRDLTSRPQLTGRSSVHGLPIVATAALVALWPVWRSPIDAVIAAIFIAYGAALVRLAAQGIDRLIHARLSDLRSPRTAATIAGMALIGSGLVDIAIAIDFALYQGVHAGSIVSHAQSIIVCALAVAIAIADRSRPPTQPLPQSGEAAEPAPTTPEGGSDTNDDETLAAFDRLMTEKELFRDPDLTLDRIARRLGIPARQISGAINRKHGRNVSQIVNQYRIDQASRSLSETDRRVTDIMFDCGFQTKSNFNREFRRITGQSPTAYRASGPPK